MEKRTPEEFLENTLELISCFETWEQSLKYDLTKLNHYVTTSKPFTFFVCDELSLRCYSRFDFENLKPQKINEITFVEEYKIVNSILINCRLTPSMKRVFTKEEILETICNHLKRVFTKEEILEKICNK